jgi:hypothetical protein
MKNPGIALASLLIAALLIVNIGCAGEQTTPSPTPTVAPSITPATNQTPSATPAPTPQLTQTPTATSTPGPTPTQTPYATPTPAPTTTIALFLEITQPTDGAQVSTGSITVSGITIPGAVVSVSMNDETEIVTVGQDGKFTVRVTLEEGPNLIEVIASDLLGNEKSATVTVIYIP